jgi:hypothetical protein
VVREVSEVLVVGAEVVRAGAEVMRAGAEAVRAGAEAARAGAEAVRAGAEARDGRRMRRARGPHPLDDGGAFPTARLSG